MRQPTRATGDTWTAVASEAAVKYNCHSCAWFNCIEKQADRAYNK